MAGVRDIRSLMKQGKNMMTTEQVEYMAFIEGKIITAEKYGIETDSLILSSYLKPHQCDLVRFALEGGRRAIFSSFGSGKTMIQLEIARQLILLTGKPFLIVGPLAVSGEFKRDNDKLNTGLKIQYISETDSLEPDAQIYITNYERIRKGAFSS